jgi:RNA polymerase sigma-70 factor (ECF subfamily)
MTSKTDEELMRLVQLGQKEALAELYERHSGKVWAYLQKRVPKQNAEDLFQDCFVKLVEKSHSWKNQPFILWLYVVLRNSITDFHRSNQVEKKYIDRVRAEESSSTDQADFSELISSMPPESSKLLSEFFKEGWSYKELSEKYDLTELSLRKRISRAIGLLKKGE